MIFGKELELEEKVIRLGINHIKEKKKIRVEL